MNNKNNIDTISGFVVFLVSVCLYILSLHIEKDARIFPSYILIALMFFSIIIIMKSLYFRNPVNENNNNEDTEHRLLRQNSIKKNFIPLLISFLCILFINLFPQIGFEISSFLLLLFIMLILDWREALSKIYIAVIVPAILILLFYHGLKLRLPLLLD